MAGASSSSQSFAFITNSPVFHPESIFLLRTRSGVLAPPRDIYELNRNFCTVVPGELYHEFLLDIGYHVQRSKTSHGRADVVVTVGKDGDLWLPTDDSQLFSVVIDPETHVLLIRANESLQTGGVVVTHHIPESNLPGYRGFSPPTAQRTSLKGGETAALMPGEKYSLTVNTRHDKACVVYTFDVVWEDAPAWKISDKIQSAFVKHKQRLSHGPTANLPGRPPFAIVYTCPSGHDRRGEEASVMMGMDEDSGKQVAIKRFTESNPWRNRKAALNELKHLELIHHPHIGHIVEYLGHDLDKDRNDVFLGWMEGRDIAGMKFDVTGPLLPEDLWSSLLSQMLLALDYLAKRNIVHEDVNPGNILYKRSSNGDVNFRLADFGNSGRSWARGKSWVRQDDFYRPLFRPPEWTGLLEEKEGGTQVTQPPADVWALAMTMVCVSGRPHATTIPHVVWDKVEQGLFSEAVEAVWQQNAAGVRNSEYQKLGFLRPMLRPKPNERAKAHEITVAIQNALDITAQQVAAAKAASLRGTPEIVGSPEDADDSATDVQMESPLVLEKEDPQVDVSVVDVEMKSS
ncbi:kinase-like domain-containing protein [Pseudoneurospora amorphoporcata]|uniref:non-specific serine/threonine protein kinase n=1 Tax=Pseudoneurospora amorphoporcata TaxID=241081 RepID=A0AAN6SAL2_9PEZI|nr:kinase-like domain-containing protein [Pseudoneurospora amorphoporcata]